MTIPELHRRVKNLDVIQLFSEVLKENKEYIADLNTSQLSKGKDSTGEDIQPYYKDPNYATMKMAMGSEAPEGVPNLNLEGDFHAGFNAESDEDGNLFITSSDSKTGKLKKIYGVDIFGLTTESKTDLKSVILPELLKKIRNGMLRT